MRIGVRDATVTSNDEGIVLGPLWQFLVATTCRELADSSAERGRAPYVMVFECLGVEGGEAGSAGGPPLAVADLRCMSYDCQTVSPLAARESVPRTRLRGGGVRRRDSSSSSPPSRFPRRHTSTLRHTARQLPPQLTIHTHHRTTPRFPCQNHTRFLDASQSILDLDLPPTHRTP